MIGVVIISDTIQIIKKVLEYLARINILDIIQRLNVLDINPVNKILETFQISIINHVFRIRVEVSQASSSQPTGSSHIPRK